MHLEKNLAALAKRWSQYVDPILTAKNTNRYIIKQSSRQGQYNLTDRQVNMLYYNNIDPIYAVEKQINDMNIHIPQASILLGLGLGYHMDAYNRMFKDAIHFQFVFEEDFELIKLVFTHANLVPFIQDKRIHFFFGKNVQSFYPEIFNSLKEDLNIALTRALNIIQTDAATAASKDYFMGCIQLIKNASANTFAFYGNDPEDSLVGIKNTFYNIDEIINNPGIKDLKGVFKGKPGIVVSTGPSLMKNLELLHEVKDKAVIVGADASLQVLKPYGLKPHMVTSLERTLMTGRLFLKLKPDDFADVYYAASPVVSPMSYRWNQSERIIVYRDFATFKWLGLERGIIDIGPSAGNMAFKLLEYMGCNPIILIGQDLAYDGELTHAEGGLGSKQKLYHRNLHVEVEGNYVPKIVTTDIWNSFRRFYEKDVAQFSGRVINATEGGAKIHGTELMTFREAIDNFIKQPLDVLGTIRKKLNTPFPAQREKDRANVIKKVVDAIKYSEELKEHSKDAAQLCISYAQAEQIDDCMQTIDAMEEKLDVYGSDKFYLIYMHYVQSYYIKKISDSVAVKHNEGITPESTRKLAQIYADMYTNMYRLINTMEEELKDLHKILTDNPYDTFWKKWGHYWKADTTGYFPWDKDKLKPYDANTPPNRYYL